MDIAADGRVFFVERGGALKVHQPSSGLTEVVGRLSVTTEFEDGLLGIALAPDFATSDHVYLFYSPAGSEAVQRVSRFTLRDGQLDLSSERIVLRIPTQREECCHSGGALLFDENGVLYISVGDNTNPFASDGYTPIDERAGRAAWDAQRTSANTRDLRGKILRIIPQADGSYRTPDDNLFSPAARRRAARDFRHGRAQSVPHVPERRARLALLGRCGTRRRGCERTART